MALGTRPLGSRSLGDSAGEAIPRQATNPPQSISSTDSASGVEAQSLSTNIGGSTTPATPVFFTDFDTTAGWDHLDTASISPAGYGYLPGDAYASDWFLKTRASENYVEAVVYVDAASGDNWAMVGFANTVGPGYDATGPRVAIRNDGTLFLHGLSGGTQTVHTSLTLPAGKNGKTQANRVRLGVEIVSNNEVKFYVEGVLTATWSGVTVGTMTKEGIWGFNGIGIHIDSFGSYNSFAASQATTIGTIQDPAVGAESQALSVTMSTTDLVAAGEAETTVKGAGRDVQAATYVQANLIMNPATEQAAFAALMKNVVITVPTPHIWHLFPAAGNREDLITVVGAGFGPTASTYEGYVALGSGTPAVEGWRRLSAAPEALSSERSINSANDTVDPEHDRIDFRIPANAVSADVRVYLNAPDFVPPPDIPPTAKADGETAVGVELVSLTIDPLEGGGWGQNPTGT